MLTKNLLRQRININNLATFQQILIPNINLSINGSKRNSFEAFAHGSDFSAIVIQLTNQALQAPYQDLSVLVSRQDDMLHIVILIQADDIVLLIHLGAEGGRHAGFEILIFVIG